MEISFDIQTLSSIKDSITKRNTKRKPAGSRAQDFVKKQKVKDDTTQLIHGKNIDSSDHQQRLSPKAACRTDINHDDQIQLSEQPLSPEDPNSKPEVPVDSIESTHGQIPLNDFPDQIPRCKSIEAPISLKGSLPTESSTPASTMSPERSRGGRPKAKTTPSKALTKQFKRSTVLRVNRPVEAWVPMDVWRQVFERCKPDLLFKLRLVCHGFKEALSSENVWKNSLTLEFGESLPEPPQGLSYFHYANLLTRHGCQGCNQTGRGQTRRTYWALQRRYCENCIQKKVIFANKLEEYLRKRRLPPYVHEIMKCIPQAKYDSWGHYQWVGEYDQTPGWANTYVSSQKVGVLKSAVDEFKHELVKFLSGTPVPNKKDLDAWFEAKSSVNDVLVSQLQAVEDFCEKRRVAKLDQTAESKTSRKGFYEEQALSLNPPIGLDVLEGCASYKRAVSISRPPVDLARSWRTLLPKIKTEAAAIMAEAEARKIRESAAKEKANREPSPHPDMSSGFSSNRLIDWAELAGVPYPAYPENLYRNH